MAWGLRRRSRQDPHQCCREDFSRHRPSCPVPLGAWPLPAGRPGCLRWVHKQGRTPTCHEPGTPGSRCGTEAPEPDPAGAGPTLLVPPGRLQATHSAVKPGSPSVTWEPCASVGAAPRLARTSVRGGGCSGGFRIFGHPDVRFWLLGSRKSSCKGSCSPPSCPCRPVSADRPSGGKGRTSKRRGLRVSSCAAARERVLLSCAETAQAAAQREAQLAVTETQQLGKIGNSTVPLTEVGDARECRP